MTDQVIFSIQSGGGISPLTLLLALPALMVSANAPPVFCLSVAVCYGQAKLGTTHYPICRIFIWGAPAATGGGGLAPQCPLGDAHV